jgi:predicted nuclease of predicted toxin-antitoxin system
MKLKLDENLSRHLKPVLTLLEHDVLTAADEGLLSQSDVVVARTSMAEGRMLLRTPFRQPICGGIHPGNKSERA